MQPEELGEPKSKEEHKPAESGEPEDTIKKTEDSKVLETPIQTGGTPCLECLKRLFCCCCCTTSSEMEKSEKSGRVKDTYTITLESIPHHEEKIDKKYGEPEDTIKKTEEAKKEISNEKTWKDLFRRWKILKSDERNELKLQNSSSEPNVSEESEPEPKLNETYRFEVIDKIYQR